MEEIKKKRGRPKKVITAESPKTSKKITYRDVDVEAVEIPQMVRIVKPEVSYSFKNTSGVVICYEDEKGKQKKIRPNSVITVNEFEANWIKSLDAYWKYGWVVENLEEVPEGFNPNTLSDAQFDKILEKSSKDIKVYIDSVDSIFTAERFKNKLIQADKPGSLIKYCESKIGELQEKENKGKMAPIYLDRKNKITSLGEIKEIKE